MAKRKQLEEDSNDLDFGVDAGMSAVQIDETVGCRNGSLDVKLVGGGTHQDGSGEGSTSSPVPVVIIEPRKEDGWEVEAFWTLLANAGYATW